MRKSVVIIEVANLLTESMPHVELSKRMDIALTIIDKLEELGMRPPQVEEEYILFSICCRQGSLMVGNIGVKCLQLGSMSQKQVLPFSLFF